jgi:hypothetical protein
MLLILTLLPDPIQQSIIRCDSGEHREGRTLLQRTCFATSAMGAHTGKTAKPARLRVPVHFVPKQR